MSRNTYFSYVVSTDGTVDALELWLVPNVTIPQQWLVPYFDKYDGTTCPRSHLIIYCRKMAACAHYEKVMIHFFQDSLTYRRRFPVVYAVRSIPHSDLTRKERKPCLLHVEELERANVSNPYIHQVYFTRKRVIHQ